MTFLCNGCNGIIWPWRKRHGVEIHYFDYVHKWAWKYYHSACWEEYETRQAMALMSELVEPPGTIIEVPKGFAMRGGFKWG